MTNVHYFYLLCLTNVHTKCFKNIIWLLLEKRIGKLVCTAIMRFDTQLRHNTFEWPWLRPFQCQCNSTDASKSKKDLAFAVHAVCNQSSDENIQYVAATTNLIFRKNIELWRFDKLHVKMDLMSFWWQLWWLRFVVYLR